MDVYIHTSENNNCINEYVVGRTWNVSFLLILQAGCMQHAVHDIQFYPNIVTKPYSFVIEADAYKMPPLDYRVYPDGPFYDLFFKRTW